MQEEESWEGRFDEEFQISPAWEVVLGKTFVKEMNKLHEQQKDFFREELARRREEIAGMVDKHLSEHFDWHDELIGVSIYRLDRNELINKIKEM